jgi:hypothetical protein
VKGGWMHVGAFAKASGTDRQKRAGFSPHSSSGIEMATDQGAEASDANHEWCRLTQQKRRLLSVLLQDLPSHRSGALMRKGAGHGERTYEWPAGAPRSTLSLQPQDETREEARPTSHLTWTPRPLAATANGRGCIPRAGVFVEKDGGLLLRPGNSRARPARNAQADGASQRHP